MYEQGLQEKLHFKRVQLGEKAERRREVTEKLIENFLKFGLWTLETLDTEMAARNPKKGSTRDNFLSTER